MSERMWCTACGIVSADQICDCNRYGKGHEMYREPHFVNYADAMKEAAHEQARQNDALVKALTECLDVLQGKEMMGVWGFLYAHGFKWTGPVLPVKDMRRLVSAPRESASE